MIRFTRNFFSRLSQLHISGIKCNYDNIHKIANVFIYEHLVLIVDSVLSETELLLFVKAHRLEYSITQTTDNCVEISIVVPNSLFDLVLKTALKDNPENIFIYNSINLTNWQQQLCHSSEELVARGFSNISISIDIDKNIILIHINKDLLSPQIVYKNIKALRFSS